MTARIPSIALVLALLLTMPAPCRAQKAGDAAPADTGKGQPPAGQQPPGKEEPGKKPGAKLAILPDSLEEMLAAALRSSPEVLQAEAKVRKAQADLVQTRLRITREVTTAAEELRVAEASVDVAKSQLAIAQQMIQNGTAPHSEEVAPRKALVEAMGSIEKARAQLRYLLGLGLEGSAAEIEGLAPTRRERAVARPAMPPAVLAALEKKVDVNFKEASLDKVLTALKDLYFPGQVYVVDAKEIYENLGKVYPKLTLDLKDVPLRQALEAIADSLGLAFVFRDYGVLVTTPQKAATLNSPSVP